MKKHQANNLTERRWPFFFRKAVNEETKALISNNLEVPEVKEYEKYFGLLAVVGRKKKQVLAI